MPEKKKRLIGKKQVLCVAGSVLLYAAAVWRSGQSPVIDNENSIKRNSYGQGERSCEVYVSGLDEKELPVEIYVGERQYTEDEALQVFGRVMSQIGELIRGANPSLEQVRDDLKLITRLDEYGVRLEWESEDNEVIDSFGTVTNRQISPEGKEVYLHVRLSDGRYQGYYQIKTVVYPPLLTKEEKAVTAFREELSRLDQRQSTEESLKLPEEFNGRKLLYREKEQADYKILLVLGVLLAFLCHAKEQADERERRQLRSRQLLLDYSGIVSKLAVFLGAGMTVPSAWERIVRDYEAEVEKKKRPVRHAYQEMAKTYCQLRSGTPEGQAYQEFGRRCQLQPYLKLSGLLEQNRKTGTKNLRPLLQMEVAEAFEQRKNLAKRQGEEASTKLLIPLFLMLGIVMIMIIVPAFLSFY